MLFIIEYSNFQVISTSSKSTKIWSRSFLSVIKILTFISLNHLMNFYSSFNLICFYQKTRLKIILLFYFCMNLLKIRSIVSTMMLDHEILEHSCFPRILCSFYCFLKYLKHPMKVSFCSTKIIFFFMILIYWSLNSFKRIKQDLSVDFC